MKTVYLGTIARSITVSDSAFSMIEELALQNAVCRVCDKPYEEARPEVAQNLCLVCFVTQVYKDDHLSYMEAGEPDENGIRQFIFMGDKGYLFSSSARDNYPQVDIAATIKRWGFSLPDRVTLGNRTVLLTNTAWSIYGDIRVNCVIVVECRKDEEDFPFVCYKHGESVYLDKTKGNTKKLYHEARRQLLQTKGSDGYYRYKQYESKQVYKSMIYTLLSDTQSQTYTQKLSEGGNNAQPNH